MTTDQKKILREISDKYGLEKDHFFISNHFVVLNKIGVEKIAMKEKITFKIEILQTDKLYSAVLCLGTKGIQTTIQYASASESNSKNPYYLEMAIKRAKSKCVLDLIGKDPNRNYSQDESDEFNG